MSHEEWAQGEYEIGYAYDQYCDTFSTAIEKLMLEVLAIILAGGRLPQFEQYHRQKISDLLEKNDLKNLLANVPIEEGEEFVHDMKILRLI